MAMVADHYGRAAALGADTDVDPAELGQINAKVMLPSAVPFILTGIRLGIGRGIVGVVVGEFFTAQSGLGGMVVFYASKFQTAEMFVPIIVLVTVGVCLTELAKRLQSRLAPWKESERDQGF